MLGSVAFLTKWLFTELLYSMLLLQNVSFDVIMQLLLKFRLTIFYKTNCFIKIFELHLVKHEVYCFTKSQMPAQNIKLELQLRSAPST